MYVVLKAVLLKLLEMFYQRKVLYESVSSEVMLSDQSYLGLMSTKHSMVYR